MYNLLASNRNITLFLNNLTHILNSKFLQVIISLVWKRRLKRHLTKYRSVATLTKMRSSPTLTFSPSDLCFDAGWMVHQHASPAQQTTLDTRNSNLQRPSCMLTKKKLTWTFQNLFCPKYLFGEKIRLQNVTVIYQLFICQYKIGLCQFECVISILYQSVDQYLKD